MKEPFAQISKALISDPNLTANEKMVYVSIAHFLPKAFPSISKLHEISGLCRQTIVNSIKKLIETGYLKRDKFGRGFKYELSTTSLSSRLNQDQGPVYPVDATSLSSRRVPVYPVDANDIYITRYNNEISENFSNLGSAIPTEYLDQIKKKLREGG